MTTQNEHDSNGGPLVLVFGMLLGALCGAFWREIVRWLF